jgi:RimJ/RimL family protein N-acetyltransferase
VPGQPRSSDAIPVFETERLRLRAIEVEDLPDYVAMWADPKVLKHIGIPPSSREQTWTRLLRAHGHWSLFGFGFWVVEEKASGRFAGEVGFAEFMREMEPSLVGTPEAGWVFAAWCHGRGFATEAAQAALEWWDTHRHGARTVCIINASNRGSFRVAEKCGYKEFARTVYHDHPIVVLERPGRRIGD